MQPFDLRTAVNRQSWAWLLDLPHRLNVAIEIVDERSLPMLPVGSGHTAAALQDRLWILGGAAERTFNDVWSWLPERPGTGEHH